MKMKGLVRNKEAIVRQIGRPRSTMRDSHGEVSETCPFSRGFRLRFPLSLLHEEKIFIPHEPLTLPLSLIFN